MSKRFAYFGTPEFSTYVLDELALAGLLPALVITTPDKPAGRGLALVESPVKHWALAHSVPLLQPESYDETAVAALQSHNCDFGIVAAYGKILPQAALDCFPLGALNAHPSLLPRYRGTSPVESQILADEKHIGVSVILMDAKMDHGPLVAQKELAEARVELGRNALNEMLWHEGGKLLAESIPSWLDGSLVPTPQEQDQATFTKKMTKEDGEIALVADGRENYLKYLAYEGWPGTFFFEDGKRIKIRKAKFENGKFVPDRVVPEGKGEMSYADFARG